MLGATPISEAKRLGKLMNADRVVILTLNSDGDWCATSWGVTRLKCRALGRWIDAHAETVLRQIEDTS